MADGVWKGVQLSQNRFFDTSTPSMRKVDDGEKTKLEEENNVVYSGH